MSSVAVIDYGMGNLHSIAKALQHAGASADVQITANAEAILRADRVVFPGVGAMRDCMRALSETGLAQTIKTAAQNKPFLGICLGMQALLADSQENGLTTCLGLFDGHVLRFPEHLQDNVGNRLKIPHMGWNQVCQSPHPLWQAIPQNSRFYFVHSYYAQPAQAESSLVVGTAHYPHAFACALAKKNIFAVQFHPEKSQQVGLQLLKNFLVWDGHY